MQFAYIQHKNVYSTDRNMCFVSFVKDDWKLTWTDRTNVWKFGLSSENFSGEKNSGISSMLKFALRNKFWVHIVVTFNWTLVPCVADPQTTKLLNNCRFPRNIVSAVTTTTTTPQHFKSEARGLDQRYNWKSIMFEFMNNLCIVPEQRERERERVDLTGNGRLFQILNS